MKTFAFRLRPGQDLKRSIETFVHEHQLRAALVVTCVGGLRQVTMRMAGATPDKQDIRRIQEDFEIVSLVGTISPDGSHLHLAISDREGRVLGGHLKEGAIVDPTAEIVLGELEDTAFTRKMDEETGFEELVITKARHLP